MNVVEKVNSICDKIEENYELNYLFNFNQESIKIAELAFKQIEIILDILILNNKDSLDDIKYLVKLYFRSPEQVINWSRIEIFEMLILLEKIKRKAKYKDLK